jgi:hypothetical protein
MPSDRISVAAFGRPCAIDIAFENIRLHIGYAHLVLGVFKTLLRKPFACPAFITSL